MTGAPDDLVERLQRHGQAHVLRFLDRLEPGPAAALVAQLQALDLDRLQRLIEAVLRPAAPPPGDVAPPELAEWGEGDEHRRRDAEARERGAELLAQGKVAAFLVAGGQGTRLGYDGPKGRYPVGPLTRRSLFAYHAQRVLATSRRYGAPAPLYVMTSEANHASTLAAFEEAGGFGLQPDQVRLFPQGMLPAIDREGRLLLASRDSLALSPDGHGGSFTALQRSGALADMAERGIEQIFYFQVDNPLAPVLDPVFIGLHAGAGAQMSTKVVAKSDPDEKVGVVARLDGATGVIEYSDLPADLARSRDEQGRLAFRAGNIAIHMIERAFVEQLLSSGLELPVHRADKQVACVDAEGRVIEPTGPNAIKMEMFVFDALPRATVSVTQEVRREDEFAPVKNASGADSPDTARQALSDQAHRWIAAAGLSAPRELAEVGPLFALDAEEFQRNLTRSDFGPVFDRS